MTEKRRKRKRHPILITLAVLILIVLAVGTYFTSYALRWQQKNLAIHGNDGMSIASITSPPRSGEPIRTLIVGTDRRPEWNSARADTIIVATLSADGEQIDFLSVPRDTRTLIPGRGYEKINYSLPFGGPSLLIDSVENLLSTEINYYFEVDYAGFIGLIDSVGGVDYEVDQGWTSPEFDIEVREGLHNRSGLEALAILKTRKFVRGDIQRVEHSQKFMRAFLTQLMDNPSDYPDVIRAISHNVKTNMTLFQFLRTGLALSGGHPKMDSESLRGSMGMLRGTMYSFPSEEAIAETSLETNTQVE